MVIRDAGRSDIPAVAELWEHSFPGGPPRAERIRTLETAGLHGGIETVVVAEENGRLAGALKTTPFTQYLGGAALPMMGLAAVGVAPWARRMGVAGAMCREALNRARGRGDVVSALYPFRPSFYHRLGWALVGELHSYRFAPENLADAGDPDVHLARPADLRHIYDCYARTAIRSNGMIRRDPPRWDHLTGSADTHLYVARGAGSVAGYMVVRYGRSRTGERRPLWVRELVADDVATRSRLFTWISRQRDLWRRVRYDAAPDEHFAHRLIDPRPAGYRPARWLWAESATVIRGPMLRLVDIERALVMRKAWGSIEPFTFELDYTDSALAFNTGLYTVTFDGSRCTVRRATDDMTVRNHVLDGGDAEADRVAGGHTPPDSRLTVDAATMAQIYAGELSVSAAPALGQAVIRGDASRLDRLFHPSTAFRLLDEF